MRRRHLRDVSLDDASQDLGVEGDELGDQAVFDARDPGLGLRGGIDTQRGEYGLTFGGSESINGSCDAQCNETSHELGHLDSTRGF